MRYKHPGAATCCLMLTLASAARSATPIDRLIAHAHEALARGDAPAAVGLFEQAASRGESIDAQVGEVRARLWAGQFRHAVTIATDVAGEHPESAEAQALLAYVEDRSGYTKQALERLHREQQLHPLEIAPAQAEAEILIDRHAADRAIELIDRRIAGQGPDGDLCRLRARAELLAPASRTGLTAHCSTRTAGQWLEFRAPAFPHALGPPVAAGNGIIIQDGGQVATSKRLVDRESAEVWVRSSAGEMHRARLVANANDPTSEVALLSLDAPYVESHHIQSAPEGAHGLCFTLSYPVAASSDAMLPVVTPCSALKSGTASLQVNVPLSPSERGSPVFDAQGRLLGLAEPSPSRSRVLRLTGRPSPTSEGDPSDAVPTIAMSELYERLSPLVVQVLVFREPR